MININPIRLSSSLLHFIAYYLPAPIISLFIVSSTKLVAPCESSVTEEGKIKFFTTLPESHLRYRSKFQAPLYQYRLSLPWLFLTIWWRLVLPVLESAPETEADQMFCFFKLARRVQRISQKPHDLSFITLL